jgi:capsular exopolysaccharide synthesis family protein
MSKKKNIFNGERNERYDYLVTKEQPLSFTSESFQKVIINLDYANIDGKIKVVQFTSTLASEGKSTFVSNLSYLLAQKNKKVILLDLDLRKPKMQRVFNVPNKNGLTDYLSGKISYTELIQHSDNFELDFIVVGEKTTAIVNILESQKLKELIEKLRQEYDYVLLDTPPIIAVSDALYVAKNADGVIFVVAQGNAKKALVKEAIETLKSNHVHIIGTVLTQVNLKSGAYGYGYDYSYNYEE